MLKSRFGQLFLSLSVSERRAFGKFIVSPFFNQQEKLSQLWVYINGAFEKTNALPQKEALFEELCPGLGYNDQQMRVMDQ